MADESPSTPPRDAPDTTSAQDAVARGFRIRRLRLLGITKPFDVNFLDEAQKELRPLGIIAGRTNTGKTAVLHFIDYAMGASSYPSHSEVQRQVRGVLLEI